MRSILLASTILLALAGAARAATNNGPLIATVVDDRAFYPAGGTANITVTLRNGTGASWSGSVALAVCSRGQQLASPAAQSVSGLPNGSSAPLTYAVAVPSLYANGYQLAIAALKAGDTGAVACTGTGTTSSSPTDTASGAINVATTPWQDPIEGWIDAPTLAGTSASAVMANLAQYHIGLLQAYDVTWRHDQPYSPAASWPNLENVTVSRSNLTSYITAAHGYGMSVLAYQLWNGAWPDYLTADAGMPGAPTLKMGLYSASAGPRLPSTQAYVDGGGAGVWLGYGWAADRIVEMNPWNGGWRRWMQGQWNLLVQQDGFDGIHLDTLGDQTNASQPAQYDWLGRPVPNLGGAIAGFADSTSNALGGRCTDINQVSAWDLQDEAVSGHSCNLYIEAHPEFGNTPFYPLINGLTEQIDEWTTRPLILAMYPQQVRSGSLGPSFAIPGDSYTVCDPTKNAACTASDPGVELMQGQIALSGASPLVLGDLDHLIPGPFFPRASLVIDPALQQWEADYWNWFVARRDVLRVGVVDSNEVATISNSAGTSIGSASGTAGSVYYLPKTRAGFGLILGLVNEVGLSSNRADDPDGTANPTAQSNLQILSEVYGPKPTGTLFYSSPDLNHGFRQALSYTVSSSQDANGDYTITATVPSLRTVGLLELEGNALTSATDYRVGTGGFIRGGTAVWGTPGSGALNQGSVHGCCNRFREWIGIDFGSTAPTTLTVLTPSSSGAPIVFRLDRPDGPVLATVYPGSGSGLVTTTVPISGAPTGVHTVFVQWPGDDVTLTAWQP